MKRNIIWILGVIVIFGVYMVLVWSNLLICKVILAMIHGGCVGHVIGQITYKFANWIVDTKNNR